MHVVLSPFILISLCLQLFWLADSVNGSYGNTYLDFDKGDFRSSVSQVIPNSDDRSEQLGRKREKRESVQDKEDPNARQLDLSKIVLQTLDGKNLLKLTDDQRKNLNVEMEKVNFTETKQVAGTLVKVNGQTQVADKMRNNPVSKNSTKNNSQQGNSKSKPKGRRSAPEYYGGGHPSEVRETFRRARTTRRRAKQSIGRRNKRFDTKNHI